MVYQLSCTTFAIGKPIKNNPIMNYLSEKELRESYLSPRIEVVNIVIEAGFAYSNQETGAPSFGDEEDWDNANN